MYPSQSPREHGPEWDYPPAAGYDIGRLNSALPKPPAYVPPPVPPAGSILEFNRPQHLLFRIPAEKPRLTLAILAVLVVIYIPMAISPDLYERVIMQFGLYKPAILAGEWWRLLTATMLHWNNPLHIIFNGYALYVIGMDLESFFGRRRFAAMYLVSALGGSVASFAFTLPVLVPEGALVYPFGFGASGAVFGLIGALGVFYGLNRSLFGRRGNLQFWNIVVVIVLNLGLGLSGIFPIDNSAHIGGLIAGAAVGFVLCPRYSMGEWINPLVRRVVDGNRGRLSWLAAGLIAADVVMFFLVVFLMFKQGYTLPGLGR